MIWLAIFLMDAALAGWNYWLYADFGYLWNLAAAVFATVMAVFALKELTDA